MRDLGEPAAQLHELASRFPERFAEAMNEDFNTSRAVALVYDLTRAVNRFGNNKKWRKRSAALAEPALAAFDLAGRVLGIGALEPEDWFRQVRERRLRAMGRSEAEVQALVDARVEARKARDWARADAIREELAELGVVLMDTADGTRWRMRVG